MDKTVGINSELLEKQKTSFLDSLKSNSSYTESTHLAYHTDLRYFLNFLQKNINRNPVITDFTHANILLFLEAEHIAGYSRNTLLRRCAALAGFSDYLNQKGLFHAASFSKNGLALKRILNKCPDHKEHRILTLRETSELYSLMEKSNRPRARRDQAILALILESGLSVGRLVELKLSDLSQNSAGWKLRLTNEPEYWINLSRSIPYLQRYLFEGRPELNPGSDEQVLFISQTGKRISRQGIWQMLHYWGKQMTQDIKLSPRLLRETAVFQFNQSGRPIEEITQILGHTNPLSTQALIRRLKTQVLKED